MKAIKSTIQEYWENLSSKERRYILSYVIVYKQLPVEHPIFKEDDLPFECVKAWLEETIAKKDWDLEYIVEPCGC